MCKHTRERTITIGFAYDLRNEVSLGSDGTLVARHPCSVGRRPVPEGDSSDPTDTTGSLPMDEKSEGSGCYSVLRNVDVQSEGHCKRGGSRSSFIAFERHDFAKLRELPRQSLRICLVDYAKIA